MDIPTKKLNSGFEMPVLGLGTYTMGESDDKRDIEAIRSAINLGITHIDTAESYADGRAEQLVGQAIKDFDRSKLFLVSKVHREHLNYSDIKQALHDSLKRMETPYLNLLLLHRYPHQDNLAGCIKAMDELADEGLIKNIGISNFNLEHTKQACKLTRHKIVATQVHYNLQFREPEQTGLLKFCQDNDLLLIAWRPINKGRFSKTGVDFSQSGISIVDDMCKKYQKTPAQIAINWLISQKNVITLAKATTPEHIKENLGAMGWQMEMEDIEKLRQNFPNQKYISDTVPLG